MRMSSLAFLISFCKELLCARETLTLDKDFAFPLGLFGLQVLSYVFCRVLLNICGGMLEVSLHHETS